MAAANPIEKLCMKARQAIEGRDWQKAKQAYMQALGMRSDLPDVHYGVATVFFQLRELTSAAHHFREVTRLDPLRSGAYINLGAVLNLLQQYDEAIAALRRGLQLDSTRVEGYYNLGLVHRRRGEAELAIQAYREALRINPRMADAHLNLANLYLEKDQLRQSLQHYEQAQQLRPGWDKAQEGVTQVKDLLDKEHSTGPTAAAPTGPAVDLERLADPVGHADFLTTLHHAARDADDDGRKFISVLQKEVEPAIKELSTCLLYQSRSRTELEDCIAKFEQALERMRSVQRDMQQRLATIREQGEVFPTH